MRVITENSLTSVHNFRDCGGLLTATGERIRCGRIYRSGHLDKISQGDLETLQALGITTIVDLRSGHELRQRNGWVDERRIHLPMTLDQAVRAQVKPLLWKRDAADAIIAAVERSYAELIASARPQFRILFQRLLREESYPLLIHCRAGKDRTGLASALIQLALGAPEEAVVQQYLRSNDFVLPRIRRRLIPWRWLTLGRLPTANFETVFTVQARYLHAALATIRAEYGDIAAYVGLTPAEHTHLRRLLLTTDAPACCPPMI